MEVPMITKEAEIMQALYDVLELAQRAKPEGQSPVGRFYAVFITGLEKLLAYFSFFIANPHP
jgi:hypothetical protein